MNLHVLTLAQITDGKAAWSEFFTGVQDTFAKNASVAPVIAVVLVVIAVLWLDYRLAKWLVRSSRSGRSSKRTTKDTR